MDNQRDHSSSGKRRRKDRHRMCRSCNQPLPDDCASDVCQNCAAPVPHGSMQSEAKEFMGWFKNQLSGIFNEVQKRHHEVPMSQALVPASVLSSPCQSSQDEEDSVSEADSDKGTPDRGLPDDYYLLQKDQVATLISAVKKTVEGEPSSSKLPKKEALFYFSESSHHALPNQPLLDPLMQAEWAKPEKKADLGSRFKSVYKLDPGCSEAWDSTPSVDLAVARLSKKSMFPSDESALLRDQMDRRADGSLKRIYQGAAQAVKASIASVSVSKALRVWLSRLSKDLKDGVRREDILKDIPDMKLAAEFLSDYPLDMIRLNAKLLASSTAARRALWLKEWQGDVSSKNHFCSLPFQAGNLFGPQLTPILEGMSSKKGVDFPQPPRKPRFRPQQKPFRRSPARKRFQQKYKQNKSNYQANTSSSYKKKPSSGGTKGSSF
ncbi:lamina-associated polypeptide 2-like [Dendropsophus ebraccatus]|uniref:lamina-associated polypeptide 2-like n=1 Tax=Dendropsophus ebraccatus TaxID=150705 RepID=UPI003831262C